MKNFKTIIILVLLTYFKIEVFGQDGKVKRYFEKSIFWYSEPISPYDIVFQVKTTVNANQRQFSQSEDCIKEAIISSVQAGNKSFDALIILQNSTYDLAIKFKDSASDKVSCVAPKINGVSVLIDANPLPKYLFKNNTNYKRGRGNGGFLGSMAIANILTKKPKGKLLVIGDDYIHSWYE